MKQIDLVLWAPDPLTRAGLGSYLRARPGLTVLGCPELHRADLALLAAESFGPREIEVLRHSAAGFTGPVLVMTRQITPELRPALTEHKVCAVLPFEAMEGEQLMCEVTKAATAPSGTPRLRLPGNHRPARSADSRALNPRELAVVRLISEGWSATDIGCKLGCSEHAVKGVIGDVISVLRLQNRPESVTRAMLAALT